MLVTGLLGLSVGFLKGGLWLACWVGAIFATLYGYPFVEPGVAAWLKSRNVITQPFLADLAVGAAIFFATLIFLFMVSSMVTSWVRDSRLNALDRSLGFLAGVVAAMIIVSAAYIPFASTMGKDEDQPAWLRDARLRPVIQWGADVLETLLPGDLGNRHATTANERFGRSDSAYRALAEPPQPMAPKTGETGYDARERQDMDRLMRVPPGGEDRVR